MPGVEATDIDARLAEIEERAKVMPQWYWHTRDGLTKQDIPYLLALAHERQAYRTALAREACPTYCTANGKPCEDCSHFAKALARADLMAKGELDE